MFQQWVAVTAADDRERANLPELVLLPGGTGVDSLRLRYSEPLLLLLALVGLILMIAGAVGALLSLLYIATARGRRGVVRERVIARDPYDEPPV